MLSLLFCTILARARFSRLLRAKRRILGSDWCIETCDHRTGA